MNRFTDNFISQLADFSNVAISSRYSYIQKPTPPSFVSPEPSYFQIQQLDLSNHSKLLQQFKKLREKLRQETRKSNGIKKEWEKSEKKYEVIIERLEGKDRDNEAAMKYLKKEIEVINEGIDGLKRRNVELEKEVLVKNKYEGEIDKLQKRIQQQQTLVQQLRYEKQKTQQILLLQKLQLQSKLAHLTTLSLTDSTSHKQLSSELIKSRQLNIALESKLKRLQDEHHLNQISTTESTKSLAHKSEKLSKQNQELKRQINHLKVKYQGQREKRKKEESLDLKKYEMSSLQQIQHEAQEKELNQLRRRVEKLTDRYEIKAVQVECETFKSMETLAKLWKSVDIAEELIYRLKREVGLREDVQKLIKVSQYKLNKIKESENKSQKPSGKNSNCSSISNLLCKRKSISRSKSKSRSRSGSRSISKSPSKTPSCYTAQKAREQLETPIEFHSYTTPKLKQHVSFGDTSVHQSTLEINHKSDIEERIMREVREKENQLRTEMEFQKYNKSSLNLKSRQL